MSDDSDEQPVLGEPPEPPEEVWERLLTATFEASPDEQGDADLLPRLEASEPVELDEVPYAESGRTEHDAGHSLQHEDDGGAEQGATHTDPDQVPDGHHAGDGHDFDD